MIFGERTAERHLVEVARHPPLTLAGVVVEGLGPDERRRRHTAGDDHRKAEATQPVDAARRQRSGDVGGRLGNAEHEQAPQHGERVGAGSERADRGRPQLPAGRVVGGRAPRCAQVLRGEAGPAEVIGEGSAGGGIGFRQHAPIQSRCGRGRRHTARLPGLCRGEP